MTAISHGPDDAASGQLQFEPAVTRFDDLSRDEQTPERIDR